MPNTQGQRHDPDMSLVDDGTLDTVFRCLSCGREFRYSSEDVSTPEEFQHFREWAWDDAEETHRGELEERRPLPLVDTQDVARLVHWAVTGYLREAAPDPEFRPTVQMMAGRSAMRYTLPGGQAFEIRVVPD